MTKKSMKNLFKLVEGKKITHSVATLYLYYAIREGQPTTLKQIQKEANFSYTSLARNNRILEEYDLVRFEKEGTTKVPFCNEIDEDKVDSILLDINNGIAPLPDIPGIKEKKEHMIYIPMSYLKMVKNGTLDLYKNNRIKTEKGIISIPKFNKIIQEKVISIPNAYYYNNNS